MKRKKARPVKAWAYKRDGRIAAVCVGWSKRSMRDFLSMGESIVPVEIREIPKRRRKP